MLRIDLAERLINDLQQTALGGGYAGAQRANAIRAIRGTLLNMAAAFNRVQSRAGPLAIADGRADTIATALAPYGGEFSWPHKSGRLLQGLVLSHRTTISDAPPAPLRAGPGCRALDPDAYVCEMTIGPPEERRFGGFTCLFVYLNLVSHGYVCWIGPNADIGEESITCRARPRGFGTSPVSTPNIKRHSSPRRRRRADVDSARPLYYMTTPETFQWHLHLPPRHLSQAPATMARR